MGFHPLEHIIWKNIKPLNLKGKGLVLAVSGGADSLAMFNIFKNINSLVKANISVCYFHHGVLPSEIAGSEIINNYRLNALKLVKEEASKAKIRFITNEPCKVSKHENEAELRNKRISYLKNIDPAFYIATAHHQDDLLETQLIRLIRGTGTQGLESMRLYSWPLIKPLLGISRQDIDSYIKELKLSYVEDPTNKINDSLRNWLRNDWLPQLDKKREGSLKSFAKSLEQINKSEDIWTQFIEEAAINRPRLMSLPIDLQADCMAYYLRFRGVDHYESGQIKEILKQIDNPKKEHIFKAVKWRWQVTKNLIYADKPLS